MGIKNLNKFFRTNASDAIKVCLLSELRGKKIAVDISIYMYKFSCDDNLFENMYLLLSIFKHYSIIPIFIFDGKPPPEKWALLQQRKKNKQYAMEEFSRLNELNDDTSHLRGTMDALKRKMTNVSKEDVMKVKRLIIAFGFNYYQAPNEADEVCALLSVREEVWACMSEDMDMFVYGCPRVIRYISLLRHTAVLYDMSQLLSLLGITQQELREICVLSGTDYNIKDESENDTEHKNENILHETLKYFKQYHRTKTEHRNGCFYDWLMKTHHNYIEDYELLKNTVNMFDVNQISHERHQVEIKNNPASISELQQILRPDGFLFS